MAGHSKWANIKHRKAKQDASRGKVLLNIFVKLSLLQNLVVQILPVTLAFVLLSKSAFCQHDTRYH